VGVSDEITGKRPDHAVRKGRGAVHNPEGRFERFRFVRDEDLPPDGDAVLRAGVEAGTAGEPPKIPTTVLPEATRKILTKNDSPDICFDRSINPYKGCEHGCVYCFARPTHSYLGLSPGLDFETKIFSKPNAAALLREELRHKSYRCEVLALGANTDPYQPVERELRITRSILEVLLEHKQPVMIITKSALALRDLDLLAEMARENLAAVFVSVTSLTPSIASTLEPRAAAPQRRLDTLRGLHEGGVPVGVLCSPMIPGLTDNELEHILEAAAAAGARHAGYTLLRLPGEVNEIFTAWLALHHPTLLKRVLNRLRDVHGGKVYDSTWSTRMRGEGPLANLLHRRFEVACRRLGMNSRAIELDTSAFRVPPRKGDQAALFP